MTIYVPIIIGFLVIYLITAIPIYTFLRERIIGNSNTEENRIKFTYLCGAVIAPGLIGLGHPPPLPFPGAVLLFPLYLFIGGGEDGGSLMFSNFVSWVVTTAAIGYIERRRSKTSV